MLITLLLMVLTLYWAYFYDRKLHFKYLGYIREQSFAKELSIAKYKKYQFLTIGGIALGYMAYGAYMKIGGSDLIALVLLFLGMAAIFDYRTTLIPNRYSIFIGLAGIAFIFTQYSLNNIANMIDEHHAFNKVWFWNEYVKNIAVSSIMIAVLYIARFINPKFFIGMGDIKLFSALAIIMAYPGSGMDMTYLFFLIAVIALLMPFTINKFRKVKNNPEYIPLAVPIYLAFIILLAFTQGDISNINIEDMLNKILDYFKSA